MAGTGRRGAGDDHPVRPHGRQASQLLLEAVGRDVRPVGFVQQKGRFGEVGRDDVGVADELAHGLHHLRRLGGVQGAVVAQHGVHQREAAGLEEVADAPGRYLQLERIAQKAGIDGVEAQAHPLPVIQHGPHLGGQVMKGEALHAGGLGRQDRRGQGAGLDAHAGKDGDDHGQRGTSETGKVMDGGHTLQGDLVHGYLSGKGRTGSQTLPPEGPSCKPDSRQHL